MGIEFVDVIVTVPVFTEGTWTAIALCSMIIGMLTVTVQVFVAAVGRPLHRTTNDRIVFLVALVVSPILWPFFLHAQFSE